MSKKRYDQLETRALWINNSATASSGITYLYSDSTDNQKLKIGRSNILGNNVAMSIDRNGVISGTFSGTFIGASGSGWDGNLVGDANITGSLYVTGLISGSDFSGSRYTGSFVGDGTGLTGVPGGSSLWTETGNDIYYDTGDVGIGTTDPANYGGYTALTLNHATNGGLIEFQQSGVQKAWIYSYLDDLFIKADDDIDFTVNTAVSSQTILSLDGGGKYVSIKPGHENNIALRVNGEAEGTGYRYLSLGIPSGVPTITAGIGGTGDAELAFKTSNSSSGESERMRIDVSGNVGIGTSTPLVNLEVNCENGATNLSASLNSSGSHHGLLIHNSLSGTDDVFSNLDFTAGTTSTGRIALVDSPFEIETVVTSLASPRDVKVDSLGVATAGVPKIYYCDSSQNKIVQASLDGSQKNEIYTGLGSPGGIALDPTAGKIYWTDFHGSHDDIKVGDMDGSGPSSVVLSGLNAPFGIAIDAANSHLYFCDNGDNVIKRVDTDGDNETTLISGGDPNYIALDLINTPNKMYWTDFDAYEIKRADLDGTNPETLVELDPGSPRGIALDISAGKMYWVDEGLDTMSRANMDGSDVETLLTGLSFTTGMGIDTVQKTIYWGDVDDNDIHRICYQKGEFSFNPGVGEKMRISHRGVEIPVVDGNVVITGSLVVTQDVSGSNITGSFFTGSFIGDGSGLTGLPDADLWTATGNDIYYNTGDVGIGTSTPDEILHIKQSEASTTGSHSIARIEYYATDDFADGDGCSIKFAGGDAAEPNNVIGRLTVSRDGADNQGAFAFKCGTDGNEEFMRISSNGNVGIGTSTPGALLHLKPSTSSYNSAFRMESSTTSEDWYMYMNSDDSLVFRNDDLDFVSFQKDTGNVGIGTTDPDKTLTVVGDISAHSSSITQQTISNTSLNALTDVGAIANYHLYLECDYNDGQSAGIALGSSDNVGAAIIYKDVGAYAQGQLEFYTKASPTTLVDPVQRMVIAADGNVGIGTDTPQAPLDVFNGSTLLGMCILNASASAFDTNRFWCTTNLTTYKQVNDDTNAAKKPSITFTVPASNKVNITLKATIDDNVDARQLWKMRITDQDSETASGSWGANTINDENYSGRYYKNTSLRTFQWYFDGDDTALNWTPGESKTMWFQIKVNNTSETVSVRAGNAFAPIIVTAESVPDNVVFVDMDS